MVMQWLLSSRFTFLPAAVLQEREKTAPSNANATATTNLSTLFSLLMSGGSPEVLAEGIETSYTGVILHVFYDKYEVNEASASLVDDAVTLCALSVLKI
jgi:hypothetical protein